MAAHEIVVSFLPPGVPASTPGVVVFAAPNPLTVEPGDSVTWRFDPLADQGAFPLRVEFQEVRALPGGDPVSHTEPRNPFPSGQPANVGGGRIEGSIRPEVVKGRLFIYNFFSGSTRIPWGTAGGINFGGLEVPPPTALA